MKGKGLIELIAQSAHDVKYSLLFIKLWEKFSEQYFIVFFIT